MSNIWFTSDLHFGHRRIIEACKRPFNDVHDMDKGLIDRWNTRVEPGDSVYVVGDFSFHKPARTAEIFAELRGQKFLVRGNHDREPKTEKLFAWVKDLYTVKVATHERSDAVQRIELCHYALHVWNQSHHGAWMLHGHSHGSIPDDPGKLRLDVGVDARNFAPVSYEEVRAIMATKTWQPADYHGAEGGE